MLALVDVDTSSISSMLSEALQSSHDPRVSKALAEGVTERERGPSIELTTELDRATV